MCIRDRSDSGDNAFDGVLVGGSWSDDSKHSACVPPLRCVIDEESTDADGDPISYIFEWDVDGTPHTDTLSTLYDDDSVLSTFVGYEETWTCQVHAWDGESESDAAIVSIETDAESGS